MFRMHDYGRKNQPLLFIRNLVVSACFYVIGLLMTVPGIIIAVIALLFRLRTVPAALTVVWSRFLFLLAGRRVHVTGREKMEKGKAYLVVANHSSFTDIPGMLTVLPDLIWVGREKLFRIPLFGTFLKMWGSIPIDTKSVMRSGNSINAAVRQARKARSVAIFPEGTRTPDGRLQEFKRGFTRILRNSDLDILPLTMNGFYSLCPKDSWLIQPTEKLEIVIHEPVPRDNLLALDDRTMADKVRGIVMQNHKGW